ncbi:hypothetical protein BaRGS_00039110 [Batillaria attramentaria]|uniref:CUB domain-containing protein n=1 Tax=Batillaria attramentaria TaxID=370345 RepID=A0ABD0J417_9CAEN
MDNWIIFLGLWALFLTWGTGQSASRSTPMCSSEDIFLDKFSTFYLTTPSTGVTPCSVQVSRHAGEDPNSRWNIFHIDVISFSLGGQDPCDPTEEHLKIVFGNSPGEEKTIMWCGNSYAPTLETRQPLVITYHSGLGGTGTGFNISLSLVDGFCQWVGKELTVSSEPLYIYSPGYPNAYDLNEDCRWTVFIDSFHEVLVDSLNFHLESHTACKYDFLSVNDNRHPTCTSTVRATTTPQILRLPLLEAGIINNVHCWWIIDAGSQDKLALLDVTKFQTTSPCQDFQLAVYDGDNSSSRRIVSGCAPKQMFQTIRSSGQYLFLDVDLTGFGHSVVDVEFTVTSSLKAVMPRVMYAGFADSYVWMDLDAPEGLGFLLRGTDDNPENYTTCIHLSVLETPQSVPSHNLSDFMYAYSGWNNTFMELGTSCGHSSSVDVISRGSKVFIKPKQPSSEVRTVWLTYRLQRFCTPASVHLQALTDSETSLKSDIVSSTGHYPNNEWCRWLISPINGETTQIRVVRSDLFSFFCNDNVTVYEYGRLEETQSKLTHWCADDTPIIMSSTGDSLLVEFITDAKITATGFELAYSSISLRNECPSMAAIIARESKQTLSSPNYPYDYPNNLDCRWRITADYGVVKLKLLFVSISQQSQSCAGHDFLVIYDDQYQCNKDIYVSAGDFQYITSPNHPDPYPSNVDCYWKVSTAIGRVVILDVLELDLPMCQDSVRVYDGDSDDSHLLARICNDYDESVLTTSQQYMYITFRSTITDGTYTGFKFRVHSGQEALRCDGRVITLTAKANCKWRIKSAYNNMTVALDVPDALLESSFTCNFDSVTIYDGYDSGSSRLGRFCGEHSGIYYSTGRYMFIQFLSDDTSQYKGFRMGYSAVTEHKRQDVPASSSSSNTGAVVGGVTGAAVFLLVCITIFLCFLGRVRHRRRLERGRTQQQRRSRANEGNNTVYFMSPVIVNQMAPPPYPGLTNPSYMTDDAYGAGQVHIGGMLPPPPSYTELETPPPYSDAMIVSHPPSSPAAEMSVASPFPKPWAQPALTSREISTPVRNNSPPRPKPQTDPSTVISTAAKHIQQSQSESRRRTTARLPSQGSQPRSSLPAEELATLTLPQERQPTEVESSGRVTLPTDINSATGTYV